MPFKILAIDSGADVRHLLSARLRAPEWDVTTCANGDDALDLVAEIRPDVVVTGLRLPGLTGPRLIRRIKAMNEAPLVIVLTLLRSTEDIAASFAAGADDYMTKPFSPLALEERIRVNLVRAGRTLPEPSDLAEHAEEQDIGN